MSESEKPKGAAVAAAILARMKPEDRERLLSEIQKRAPDVGKAVSEEIPRLDQLLDLEPKGLQLLLAEITHGDVVLSLKLASENVRYALLTALSTRRRTQVEADLDAMPPVRRSEVTRAQERILQTMDRLRTEGRIRGR